MPALSDIGKYFDLSIPYPFLKHAPAEPPSTPMLAAPKSLPSVGPSNSTTTMLKPAKSGLAWQLATYCLVVLSILASRLCNLYRAGAISSFTIGLPYLLLLAIVSLIAFPVVYTKTALNVQDSVFVRIALIFTAGMGWEKIAATAIGK